MTDDAKKSIALVGAGLIGRRHAEAIQASGAARLSAIADPSDDGHAFALTHGTGWVASASELLDGPRPDGVIIATPNQTHVELGLPFIEAGIPILVEKPVAENVAAAERLVVAAERAGVPLLVGHHRRHNPIIQDARKRIDAGEIGRIVAIQASCWLYKPAGYFSADWRTARGAGPVMINLIHDVDCLRYLCGDVVDAVALASNAVRGHPVEDTAAVVLAFASGALATLSVSDTVVAPWSWELTAAENPAYPATGQSCYLIGGTHGALEIPAGRLWSQPSERGWWEEMTSTTRPVPPEDPLIAQIRHFVRVIDGDEKPLVSGREGLETLRVIERILQCADAGGEIATAAGC